MTIISGLARGIDGLRIVAPWKAAVELSAVMDTGLDQIYPPIIKSWQTTS